MLPLNQISETVIVFHLNRKNKFEILDEQNMIYKE